MSPENRLTDWGLDDQIWRQISRGDGGEGQQVCLGGRQVCCGGGEQRSSLVGGQLLPGSTNDVGGDYVDGRPVQGCPGPVIAHALGILEEAPGDAARPSILCRITADGGRDAIGEYLIALRRPGQGASLNGGYRSVTRTNA